MKGVEAEESVRMKNAASNREKKNIGVGQRNEEWPRTMRETMKNASSERE